MTKSHFRKETVSRGTLSMIEIFEYENDEKNGSKKDEYDSVMIGMAI